MFVVSRLRNLSYEEGTLSKPVDRLKGVCSVLSDLTLLHPLVVFVCVFYFFCKIDLVLTDR